NIDLPEDFELIAPREEFVSNYIVLAQSWKKTQNYIRRHNWYADVLELDCSTINLERTLKEWSLKCKKESYKPSLLKVVPAPKNAFWKFNDVNEIEINKEYSLEEISHLIPWEPFKEDNKKDRIELRPLAHLNICDQTLATSAMLCLADSVESAQGSTEENNAIEAQKNRVFSYGNRLQCEWITSHNGKKRAKFGWANSQVYRKYYEDYRTFLSRPKNICQYIVPKLNSHQNLFIVSLDLKGFFDHIDRTFLINELKSIHESYMEEFNLSSKYESEDEFWRILKSIMSWKWERFDDTENVFGSKSLPQGLPQGLVASGFFSNAYLLGFDNLLGDSIGYQIDGSSNRESGKEFKLVIKDYCRYVDDLRLVVEGYDIKDTDQNELGEIVTKFVAQKLSDHLKKARIKLMINEKKTKVVSYRQMSTENNVSSLMGLFQGVLSGTPDADSLQQVMGGLDGLLQISEELIRVKERKSNWLLLSKISIPNVDVRDDTLKRFAAIRIAGALRTRRGMTDLGEFLGQDSKGVTLGELLDHEFETTARKLIACWAENPSLTLLLKAALDLYPDPSILDPILEALEFWIFTGEKVSIDFTKKFQREIRVIQYIIADLFRAAAVDIGFRPDIDYPTNANRDYFRQEIALCAKRVIQEEDKFPWYVKQQALLFLASLNEVVSIGDTKNLESYNFLHNMLSYKPIKDNFAKKYFPISLVVQQLHPNEKKYANWFSQLMNTVTIQEQIELIDLLVLNRPDLLPEIRKVRAAKGTEWLNYISKKVDFSAENNFKLFNKEWISLIRVVQNTQNPFVQENALLMFLYIILKHPEIESILHKGLSIKFLDIYCFDWREIQNLSHDEDFLKIRIMEHSHKTVDNNLYLVPEWVPENKSWLYALGSILRACLTGELDFTASSFLSRNDVGRYNGLRSTWFTRRFGLANSSSGLSRNQTPISPWLSELLFCMLQWPGVNSHGKLLKKFEDVKNANDLLKIVYERMTHQRSIFGKITKTPVYVMPTVSHQEAEDQMFRVAIVQTLFPKTKDFITKDPLHWTPSLRAQHRSHLASICNLVRLKLKAWCKAQKRRNLDVVDLIIFPELSVHPDDLWLLRRLSDSTKASIFAGMTFIKHDTKKVPINQAIWILRSQKSTGREFVEVRQGKWHMTKEELAMGIEGHRPYQVLVEFKKPGRSTIRVAGAICYDATDLSLVADLRDISDVFVVAALNKDINTFNNMVGALHYHMYQPVILANTGEFGGSTAQAPFTKHDRLIAHVHGQNQIAVSLFEIDPTVFKLKEQLSLPVEVKTSPAGFPGRV
ncbi:RNA-directed DNA polymerase, partial [Saccharibacillus brassicae]|uniref:RNA-directed DNA polymerase n=2 Tax=Saccharibacillus TaxID=456492 RepID=UPI0039EAA116